MPNGVACSVANCSFWEEGNNCGASAIKIEIDQHSQGKDGLREEFAGDDLGLFHEDQANQSAATCCLTFKPKEGIRDGQSQR